MDPTGLCLCQLLFGHLSALSVGQSVIGMPECLEVTLNMVAEAKFQPSSCCDESRGTVDQLLDHGLDPPALGRVTAGEPVIR
jgi:hypothetical protein